MADRVSGWHGVGVRILDVLFISKALASCFEVGVIGLRPGGFWNWGLASSIWPFIPEAEPRLSVP